MINRRIHPQFESTFSYFGGVPEHIRESLWNYLAYGYPPGSFMTAVLENNFLRAHSHADGTWTQKGFRDLAKWIFEYMPSGSYGSKENVEAWKEKTDEERFQIMTDKKLRPNEFDILSGRAVP
jgi:hypothetical protein